MQLQDNWRRAVAAFPSTLWDECPMAEGLYDPTKLFVLDEPWIRYDTTDDYTLTQSTTGAAAMSIAAPGVLEIDSNSTTVVQGVNLQLTSGACIIPAAGKDIWAEFYFKIVDTFDDCELFVGLSEVDTAILDTSAMASTNVLAFWCVTDDGVILFGGEKAGTGTTKACTTIAEATYVRLGFHVRGVTSVQQYVNGAKTGAVIETANIPIVKMVPSFVCQSGGTADPIMHLAGYRIAQLR